MSVLHFAFILAYKVIKPITMPIPKDTNVNIGFKIFKIPIAVEKKLVLIPISGY